MKKFRFAAVQVLIELLELIDYLILLFVFPWAYNDNLQYKFRTIFGDWAMMLEMSQIKLLVGEEQFKEIFNS